METALILFALSWLGAGLWASYLDYLWYKEFTAIYPLSYLKPQRLVVLSVICSVAGYLSLYKSYKELKELRNGSK